jgi:hypothetical protein
VPPQAASKVTEADLKRCEEFARAEVTDADHGLTGWKLVGGLVLVEVVPIFWFFTGGPLAMPDHIYKAYKGNQTASEAIQQTYDAAMTTCLQPPELESTLGPEHPDVAQSMDRLATRYAALGNDHKQTERKAAVMRTTAESLYRRALAIREKALGPDHLDVAATLNHYAALLRKMNRAAEADALDARAQAIRATTSSSLKP